jgi:phosphoribosylformimino-5-aminoimidazole carboxamide ribotide isomerase
MQIFAAIDLKNGQCVRLRQGDPNAETIYGDDPAAMAEKWASLGTDWLHVVNLDGAFGDPAKAAHNTAALQAILARVTAPLQFGGGLRNVADIAQALELGVSRVVIGSMAAERPEEMRQVLQQFGPERVALGLDVKDGRVATHGWQRLADTDLLALVHYFHQAGLGYIIYTDISRDGMLLGANIAAAVELAQAGRRPGSEQPPFKVIVSGGVASLEDIRQIKAAEAAGLEGVIIGQALYTGAVDLAEAMRIAHPERGAWER